MNSSKFLQTMMSSLPAADWPPMIAALRSDTTVWNSIQDEERITNLLRVPRSSIKEWSPAALALTLLKTHTSIQALTALPLQPLEPGLRIQAVRAYEALSLHSSPERSLDPVEGVGNLAVTGSPDLAQSGLLALALRERRRLTGSWYKLGTELRNCCSELIPFWETPLVILYGLVPDSLDLLKTLINPDTSQEEQRLGIHALLSNPHTESEQIHHLQEIAETNQGNGFTSEQWLYLVNQIARTHPELAPKFMQWLIDQGQISVPSTKADNLNACQQEILLAEAHLLARREPQALAHIQQARSLNLHVQAELDTTWAYLTNQQMQPDASSRSSSEVTKALRKSISTLSEGGPDTSLLLETQSLLSEVLLEAGDASETAKWLEDLVNEAQKNDSDPVDTSFSPSIYLQAARLAQQTGDPEKTAELLNKAYTALEARSTSIQPKSLQHRLMPQSKQVGAGLAELVTMALESNLFPLAAKAARYAVNSQPHSTDKLLLFGQALHDPAAPAEACQVYEIAVGLSPNHLEARRQLAGTLETMEAWTSSLPHRIYTSSQLQETGQENTADLHALGNCAYHAKQYHTALKACLQAIEIDPEAVPPLLLLARTQAALEEYASAMDTYHRVTQLSPASHQAWLGISEIQVRLGQSQQALETLRAAAQAAPDSVEVNLELGDLLFIDHAYTSAAVSLKKAYELARSSIECQSHADPLYYRAAYLYGQTLIELGEIEQAHEVAEEAYHHSEIPERYAGPIAYQYAQTLLHSSDIQNAIEPLEVALGHGIDDYPIQMEYARVLLTLKTKPGEAVRALQQVLKAKPDHGEAVGWLAIGLHASGEVEQAFTTYHKALETELTKDNQWHAKLSYGLGCTAKLLGKQDLALAALQEAVQIEPANIEYLRQLTEVYWSAGLAVNALETARTALYLDQDDPELIAWYSDQVLNTLQKPVGEINQTAHKEKRKFTDPVISLAAIEAKSGNADTVNLLRHAISMVPERTDLYPRLARHELLAGSPLQAVEALQKLLTFNNLTLDSLQEGARLAQETGNNKLSADFYRRAAQCAQGTDAVQFNEMLLKLAGVQASAQNYHAALQTVQQLLAQSSSDIRPYILQAEIYQTLEQPDSVTSSLENAIPNVTIPEEQLKVFLLLINSLINQGNLVEAYHHAVKGCSIIDTLQISSSSPSGELYVLAAYLANNLLFFEQARAYLSKWQSLEQKNKVPANRDLYLLGLHLNAELAFDAGEDAVAAACLDAYTYHTGHHFQHLALQSRLLIRQRDHERAASIHSEAQKISPQISAPGNRSETREKPVSFGSLKSAVFDASALVSISITEAECHAWDKALEHGRQAIELCPTSPRNGFNLACLLARRAEYQHLCSDARVVTHAPGESATSQGTQEEFTGLVHSTEKLLRSAAQILEEKGHTIPASTDLAHWKLRGSIAFQTSDSISVAAPQLPPAAAPWVLSAEDSAAWLAYLRRSAVRNPEIQKEVLPAATSSALQHFPHHPLVLLQSALVLLDSEPVRGQEMLQSSEDKLSDLHPDLGLFARVILAHHYASSGQPAQAAALIQQPLAAWNDEPHFHTLTASIQWAQTSQPGEEVLEDCFSHLEESIRLDPKHLQAYLNLGEMVLTSAGHDSVHVSKAVRLLDRATRIYPQESGLWLILAQLLYRSGKPEELEAAGRCAEQAILSANTNGMDAQDIKPHLLRAEIALQQGNPDLALKFIENAQAHDPTSTDALLAQVRALEALNQPANALQVLEKIIAQSQGTCLPLALRRAELLAHSGDLANAQVQLQQLAIENGSHPEIFAQLAKTLSQAGDEEGALKAARAALQANGATPESTTLSPYALSEMHQIIGTVLSQTGQLDSAVVSLDQAIRLAPSAIENYLTLAQVYQKQRQHSRAQKVLEQAISVAPHDFRPFYQAGLALKDSKDYLKAEALLRRAVELAPENVTIRRQLAAVVALNLVHNPRSVIIR